MTARQFLELGEDPVGTFLELVNGQVAISPGITPDHSHADTGSNSTALVTGKLAR